VIVSVKATSLSTEAEQALEDDIDENTEAILELGGLIADMDEAHTRMNNLEARLDRLPANVQDQINELNNRYNALADRVAALENAKEGS
jgi:predicted nuclease with TOPRIM domain